LRPNFLGSAYWADTALDQKKQRSKLVTKNVLPVTKSTYGKKQQNNVSNTTLLKAMKFIIFISGIAE